MFDPDMDHECTTCGEECNCGGFPCDGCSLCNDDLGEDDDFDIDRDFGDENDIEWE